MCMACSSAPTTADRFSRAAFSEPGRFRIRLRPRVPATARDSMARGVMLAIGNSDVPVGQYTQKIFKFYDIDENAIAAKLTYGSNVKEVTTAVSEGTVDCGIIYASDAYSAGLTVAATATAEMCGQVIYPAAVLNTSEHQDAAAAFLAYLQGAEASAEFEAVLFTPLSK